MDRKQNNFLILNSSDKIYASHPGSFYRNPELKVGALLIAASENHCLRSQGQ